MKKRTKLKSVSGQSRASKIINNNPSVPKIGKTIFFALWRAESTNKDREFNLSSPITLTSGTRI